MKISAKLTLGIALIAGSFASAIWVQAGQNDSAAEASAAYAAKDWSKSAQLYGELVKAHPEIPQLWFRLGTSQQ